MTSQMRKLGVCLLLSALTSIPALNSAAAVYYVNAANPAPVAPYTDWSSAATNIQDAVDAASAGDLVLVTDGIYQYGGRVVYMTNRVAVTQPLTVQSVNGPGVTTILGYQVPGTTNGDAAVRCVYLTNGAALIGFTLTNGATQSSGDYYRSQCGGGVWCESSSALVSNCVLAGNSATNLGGGAYGGTLNNCVLTGNSAIDGGGADYSTLYNCSLISNSALYYGGGVSGCKLSNCTLTGNWAGSAGGGAYIGTLNNCILTGNSCPVGGGGASGATLNNCSLISNTASLSGGGADSGTLNNCTLTGNSTQGYGGGGVAYSTANNCIAYFNHGYSGVENDYNSCTLNYCCTTPLPSGGSGNFTDAPLFENLANGDLHLQSNSPCINSGNNAYAAGATDLDGNPRISGGTVDVGAYEFQFPASGSPPTITTQPQSQSVVPGTHVTFSVSAAGAGPSYQWQLNGVPIFGATRSTLIIAAQVTNAGSYLVVVSNPYGSVSSSNAALTVLPPPATNTFYVDLNSPWPAAPYTSWSSAATNIQDAVDAASAGDLVVVTNGVYQVGSRVVDGYGGLTNRVALIKALTLQSVNGPGVTSILGYQVPGTTNGYAAIRCVYLTNGAVVAGFTLSGGATLSSGALIQDQSGGGVWCASTNCVVSNCVLIANAANDSGGGAYYGTLTHCSLIGNAAHQLGGGASSSLIDNSLVASNFASTWGGGAYSATLNNCSLVANSTGTLLPGEGGGVYGCALTNCTLMNNVSYDGGGASESSLIGCILIGNSTSNGVGGGVAYSTAKSSVLSSNYASYGGGAAAYSFLTNCTMSNNWARLYGGASYSNTLAGCTLNNNSTIAAGTPRGGGASLSYIYNSTLSFNSSYYGGGASDSVLTNCTLTGNSGGLGGGAYDSALTNCLIFGNSGGEGGGLCGSTTNSAIASNCVLSNNVAVAFAGVGGGAYGGTLINSILIGNSSFTDGGGAAYFAWLINCALSGNSAVSNGGGSYRCTLNNCTLAANSAGSSGGGSAHDTLYNCIVYFNNAPNANFDPSSAFSFCCTTPLPLTGANNFTNAPLLINPSGGNLRLQSNSPCINAGNNIYVVGSSDLDGNPRISRGTVDIGAYEFQNPASIISYAWLQQYGLPTDGSADFVDSDGDGMNNWQEWRAGTDPTNPNSLLKMLSALPSPAGTNVTVSWSSVSNRNYYLQRANVLGMGGPTPFSTLQSNITGVFGTTSWTDTNAPAPGPAFYRVGVQ